ncbi:internal virion protein [Salmonella phage SP6]|uniref:Internal virion protein n=2 Tax=Enterobacteria phage SP6 TaxID=2907955 RepID=Q7Y5N5_BPSP6|nr:internal virion protein [Salmonella phage SP6]AAP48774.1 gp35 [Salmonella phage SP6]AAR90026.1 34 [Salmonella phage SP6]EDL7973928.1 hypothetical protein [Salmonella enterica subsp. enterica serovar Heidelberg]
MAIGTALTAGLSSVAGSAASGGFLSSLGGAIGAEGVMGSAMSFLGGTTGGFSNAGLLSAGMQMLNPIGDYFTQKETAKAMKKAQDEQWRQQLIATREAYASVANAERSASKQYHSELIDNQVSLLQQRAQVALLAGASGTGGNSITSMLNDLTGEAGRNQATIIDNYETQQINFANQLKSIQKGGQMMMRSFEKPSAFSAIAKGVSGIGEAYLSGHQKGTALSKAWSDSRTYSSGTRGV